MLLEQLTLGLDNGITYSWYYLGKRYLLLPKNEKGSYRLLIGNITIAYRSLVDMAEDGFDLEAMLNNNKTLEPI